MRAQEHCNLLHMMFVRFQNAHMFRLHKIINAFWLMTGMSPYHFDDFFCTLSWCIILHYRFTFILWCYAIRMQFDMRARVIYCNTVEHMCYLLRFNVEIMSNVRALHIYIFYVFIYCIKATCISIRFFKFFHLFFLFCLVLLLFCSVKHSTLVW